MADPASAYRYIQERLGVDVKSADAATELASLGVDSLSLLEMVFEIEEKFGVKVDERTPTPRSCGELVALIERLAAAKSWPRAASR
jgi:acyl carrier protein